MKRAKRAENRGGTQKEYDFRPGIRGKYAKRFADGTNLVALEPDVARLFTDSKSVNDTLRTVARLSRRIASGK